MKLSIAWIFDHIQADWKRHDISALVARLGATTAEIDHMKEVIIHFDDFSLAQVIKHSADLVTVYSVEWKKEVTIPVAHKEGYSKDQLFLIIKEKNQYRFATLGDVGSEKEDCMPAVSCPQELIAGGWKQKCDPYDYIITLDNKAVTHRPDLWGHRGFAREVAAILGVPLRAEDDFLVTKPIKYYEKKSIPTVQNPLKMLIESKTCKRFAGIYIPQIENRASSLLCALRLARIDARPIDLIVDATNYGMYDWGQPMHAFDATRVADYTLIAQQARSGEKLTLLDGETISLTVDDCIISDGQKALALAGIMGGLESGVSKTTTSLIVEAANFDATDIRLTAARYKRRTEASSRFEKTLDPHQNTAVLLRFLKILEQEKVAYTAADAISSLGALMPEKSVVISHDFIERKLGIIIDSQKIIRILQALGFGVQYDTSGIYTVVIPSYRATKDIAIKEDIVEEVGRSIGYNSIPARSPLRIMKPIDHSAIMTTRTLKQACAYGLQMHEVYNYAFYDEEYIHQIGIAVNSVAVLNPVSENWKRLINSLVPHLLKNVQQAAIGVDELRFFEIGAIWDKHNDILLEKQSMGLVFYAKKGMDFYDGKKLVQQLFDTLRMEVVWRKAAVCAEWFDKNQTAEIIYNNIVIGYAGKISPELCARIVDGDLFIVEMSFDAIVHRDIQKIRFTALAKYQPVSLDISMLLPYRITADALSLIIASVDNRIRDVHIVDFFEKDEWGDRRSLTMRFTIVDEQRTLIKEDIDAVHMAVIRAVTAAGAEVR